MGFSTSPLYPDSGTADALKINGTPVSGAKPANGQTLVYSSSIDEYVPQTPSGGGGGGGGGAPAAHAATHATGGTDPITPANIGAVAKTGDVMTGTLNVIAGSLEVGDFGPTSDTAKVQINNGNIDLYNGAGINFSGIGFAAAQDSLRTAIRAAAASHTHALSNLTQSGATTSQVPTWNGTAWVPQTPSGGGGGGAPDAHAATHATGGTDPITPSSIGAVAGSVGAVDNAVLRADVGTGIVQNSGLIVDDAIVSFAVTGVAATDIVTATGSAFANGQPVRFTALTGGTGLNTTTNYYVINVSGATFQVSTSVGGGASLFTTDITAGTLLTSHSVQANVTLSENTTATNSALVLTPKGTGAFILGPKPDGTAVGGNARGANAVDLQTSRGSATQVASGTASTILGGANCTASSDYAIAAGFNCNASNQYTFCHGNQSTASGGTSFCFGEINTASGTSSSVVSGSTNTSSATYSAIIGGQQALADRRGMQAHAIGRFAANGDAQRSRFVMRCKTTTNTAVEMALDGATTYLTIPSGKVIFANIKIVGTKSDGSAVATYERQYAVKNVSATSTQVYAPITIGSDNTAGTVLDITTQDTGDYISVKVTGIAAETWRWVASVDAVEVAYGT